MEEALVCPLEDVLGDADDAVELALAEVDATLELSKRHKLGTFKSRSK